MYSRTVNKDLNSWTSAINGFFDSHRGVRPLNTHTITNLKKRYHDKQLLRTLQRLGPNALEPAEARIGVPPGGLQILLRDAVAAAANVVLCSRLVLLLVITVFFVRPATMWAFEPYDVSVYMGGGHAYLVCVSRKVKLRPEFLVTPNRREVDVPIDESHPLCQLAYLVYRMQTQTRGRWCCALREQIAERKRAPEIVTEWLRTALTPTRLPLPSGRRLSSYSLRIAGISICSAHHVDAEWICRWALWRSKDMAERYTQRDYARSTIGAQLMCFAATPAGRAATSNTMGAARGGRSSRDSAWPGGGAAAQARLRDVARRAVAGRGAGPSRG